MVAIAGASPSRAVNGALFHTLYRQGHAKGTLESSMRFQGLRGYPSASRNSLIPLFLYFCHGRGRGFEPRPPRHKPEKNQWFTAMCLSFMPPSWVLVGSIASSRKQI
jgi:hypothetical protein